MTRVHAVLHHRNGETTLAQAETALACGADGVFLISHHGQDAELAPLAATLAGRWASTRSAAGGPALVGLCLLTFPPALAMTAAAQAGAHAVWVGASGVRSTGLSAEGRELAEAKQRHAGIAVFAGVAFKYEAEEPDAPAAARLAASLGMLPTTSGRGTGLAPPLAKIEAMSQAVGGQLAIASGMTVDNVAQFAPLVSHILVSTGVSRDEHTLDPDKLALFLREVRRASRPGPRGLTGSG
jgi:hypothetical protein